MNGFALWVGFGAAVGLWQVARSAPKQHTTALVNMGLLIMFAGLVGARLFYTWINRDYFSAHLIEIPQIWLGGVSWPGAVGGAWIAFFYFSFTFRDPRGSHISPGWLGDRLYPLLPPLSISIWLGCWLTGVAYGPFLPAGTWWAVPSLDESGAYNLRLPLQLLSALSLLAFFALLERLVKQLEPAGRLSGWAVFGLIVHLLCISLLRADQAPFWKGMRLDTWMAAAYLVVLVVTVLFFHIVNQFWPKSTPHPARNLSSQERI